MRIFLILPFLVLATYSSTFGQLIIDNTLSPQQLVEDILVGSGVTISNVTYTGDALAGGYFDGSATNIGLNSGVLLSTGYNEVAIGPNDQGGATNPDDLFCSGLCLPGDADLDALLTSSSTNDATVLEFDFIPLSDTIRFRYVFASEEYPEFVCSDYNDIFAFLLSGGTTINYPAPGTNIAIVPGTLNTPVTINNVNSGIPGGSGNCDVAPNCGGLFEPPCCTPSDCEFSYSSYYIDNTNGTTIQFDGFTVVLEALAVVTPCESYHIKLAIADAGDGAYDSGVFLEASSFTTGILDIDVATANLDSTVVESCGDVATISFSFNDPVVSNYTIPYSILGTATNGVDYTTIIGNAFIPAGQTTVELIIDPVDDGFGEGTETVLIEVQSSVCTLDTVVVFIMEENPLTPPNVFCGSSTQTTLSFGWDPVPDASGYEISLDGGTTWIAPTPGPLTHDITGLTQGDIRDIIVRPIGGTLVCNFNPTGATSCTTNNCAISASTSASDALCNGDSNGSATVTISGGTGPFTYIWDTTTGSQMGQTANGLAAGTYTVSINDALGCISSVPVTVGEPSLFSITNASSTDATCGGNNDGSAAVTVSGGTMAYTYSWSPGGQNTAAINNLAVGSYTCVVTDLNGCSVSTSFNISGAASMNTTLIDNQLTCNGDTNGSLDLEISGGTAPYAYQWDNGAGSAQDPTGLEANTYNVTISDANGCISIASAQVTEPMAMTASAPNTDLACNGNSNGSLDLTVIGGTAPYLYNWNNGLSTVQDPTNLAAGNYTVVVTDDNGCMTTTAATVNEPNLLVATVANTTIACNGGMAALDLQVQGGTAPHTFLWDNGAGNNEDPTGLSANTYTVLVTDINGCTATASASITEPTALVATVSNTQLACNGDSNGNLDLEVSGGMAPYLYTWDNGAGNNQDPTGLAANTYNVTISDANGCTTVASAQVTEPLGMTASLLGSTPTGCTACIGTANISINGGLAPYAFLWSNGETTEDPSNLCSGNNTVVITDANNCSISFNVTTTITSSLSISGPTLVNGPTCMGDCNASATVSTNSGAAPFVFAWDAAAGNQTTATATNLCAGNYVVSVSDANGCLEVGMITINDSQAITASAAVLQDVSCFGGNDGQAQAFPAGGVAPYTYQWDSGENTAIAIQLDQGFHEVTIFDSQGCTTTAFVLLGQPSPLSANISNLIPVNCTACDGGATANVTGGTFPFTYLWSNGSTVASPNNLCEGNNQVTVTDANGCVATTGGGVATISNLVLTAVVPSGLACSGDCTSSATVTLAGGEGPFTYVWNTIPVQTTATATNLCAGTYDVTITDVNGCIVAGSASITDPTALSISVTGTDPVCAGSNTGTLTATVTGGYTPYAYNWSVPGNLANIFNVPEGNHSVTVTDAFGCSIIENFTLTAPNPLLASLAATTPATCFGEGNGTASLDINGGASPYQVVWDNTEITNPALFLYAGPHSATVTDAAGCQAIVTAMIGQPTELVAYDQSVNPVLCYGDNDGNASLSASGGLPPYTFAWSSGQATSTIFALPVGTYWVTVTDANDCALAPIEFVVTGPGAPLGLELSGLDPTCNDATDGSINSTVTWGTPGYQYNWSNFQQGATANNLGSGTYTLTVTDQNGCTITESYSLNNPSIIEATLTAEGTTCYGDNDGSIHITSTTGGAGYYSYSLDGNNFQLDPNFYALVGGDYVVYIRDLEDCGTSYPITVDQPDPFDLTVGPLTSILLGDSLQLEATISIAGAYEYSWTASTNSYMSCTDCPNPIVAPTEATTYELVITDGNGCTREDLTIIQVTKERFVYIPNVFTPNGDNNNDFFTVYGGPMISNIRLMRVFDRWGELLFETANFQPNDPVAGWDGTFKGKPMNPGVMVYHVEVEFIDGWEEQYKGGITILK